MPKRKNKRFPVQAALGEMKETLLELSQIETLAKDMDSDVLAGLFMLVGQVHGVDFTPLAKKILAKDEENEENLAAQIIRETVEETPRWLICIYSSFFSNTSLNIVRQEGTYQDIREELCRLVSLAKKLHGKEWVKGTNSPDEVEICGNGLCAHASFKYGEISYKAIKAEDVEISTYAYQTPAEHVNII